MLWQRALHAYAARLKTHPYTTNMASGLLVCSTGDVLSQRYESDDEYSSQRTLKLAGWGAGWMGPAGVVWYGFLERFGGGLATKVAMNQCMFAPTTNALFYGYNEVWKTADDAEPLLSRYVERMSHEFIPTMCTSVVVWVPTQAFNLSVVPLHFRPLFLNTAFILWTAYLSYRGHKKYDGRPEKARADSHGP